MSGSTAQKGIDVVGLRKLDRRKFDYIKAVVMDGLSKAASMVAPLIQQAFEREIYGYVVMSILLIGRLLIDFRSSTFQCITTKSALKNSPLASTPLFQASVDLGYHPKRYKEANTVVLKKPNKGDYSAPKAYRPIALMDAIGKLLESILAKRLTHLAEKHSLLPNNQMGARKGRSTETTLELLTEQVHTVWGQGPDKAGAFPTMSHARAVHNLRKRKVPKWITDWIRSFLKDRTTTLALLGEMSASSPMHTGTPQGSPLSPILYLFYNADLLKITNRAGMCVSSIGFVDDINLLAYGRSREENCRTLERLHVKCAKSLCAR